MENHQFDDLTRALARRASRRGLLRGLAATLAGALASGRLDGATAAVAPRLPNGSSCTRATDCASFMCVDGVCCDTACTRQCESCAGGTCVPVTGAPVGNRPACPGSGACAATCDGVARASCAFPGLETACGVATCANGWLTTHACGGNGSCVPTATNCAPFGCDPTGTACATGCIADAECGPGHHCDDGQCRPDEGLGAACDEDSDCQHGLCVDGVCCVEQCGACHTCNAPGNEGFCVPAPDGVGCAGGRCCAGVCVDVSTDVEHCGECGNICVGIANERVACANGACATECLPGFQRCTEDGSCLACCSAAGCPTCGALDEPCCAGDACTDEDTVCREGFCRSAVITIPICTGCGSPGVTHDSCGQPCPEPCPDCHVLGEGGACVAVADDTSCGGLPGIGRCCAGQCCPDCQACVDGICAPVADGDACRNLVNPGTCCQGGCCTGGTICTDTGCADACGGCPACHECVDGECQLGSTTSGHQCGGVCCPKGRTECCGDACCFAGSTCCGDNTCCPPGSTCLSGVCCPAGSTLCNGACCAGQCNGDGQCCPTGEWCDGECCPAGESCCSWASGTKVCRAFDRVCAGQCKDNPVVCCEGPPPMSCPPGHTCCGFSCCPPGRTCGFVGGVVACLG